MAESTGNIQPQLDLAEHDSTGGVTTKRTLLYGWDSDGLVKRRIAVDDSGNVQITEGTLTARYDIQGDTIYEGSAPVGTAEASELWNVVKYDLADLTAASAKLAVGVAWTDRAGASYG